MERLTKRNELGCAYYPYCFKEETCGGVGASSQCDDCAFSLEICERLAHYEDLEEQGLLLKLPCKVGDVVYQITRNFVSEFRIRKIDHYDNGNIFFDWTLVYGIYKNVAGFHIDEIGKTVFLTKEEAEAKLKEMEGK